MRVTGTTTRRRLLRALTGTALAGALGLTACGGGADPRWEAPAEPPAPKVAASIVTPAPDSTDVPASAEIEFTTENATSATLELRDADGNVIDGALRPGTTTWVPATSLAYDTTYTATVTATGEDGRTATATSTFTTMAKPAKTVGVSSNIGDDMVVGIGMPMVLRFSQAVPKEARATIERRLWVETVPEQEGAWHWFSDRELHYRPKAFWKAGTKLNFRIGTGGLPLGGDLYGRNELTVVASVRPDPVVMTVDNATKQMTVTHNGKVVKVIPVSLGKPKTPSSSGTMVIMERLRNTIFDTMDDPNPENRYRVPIEYAMRLTWGGEFIHAAPWSVADQGKRNVSHGCVNVSMENAAWLFNLAKLGDPVTVKGTEVALQKGNGWTDWSMSWEQYIKGSALPYSPPTSASAGPSAAGPSASASTGA